jgi:hypothetical protein
MAERESHRCHFGWLSCNSRFDGLRGPVEISGRTLSFTGTVVASNVLNPFSKSPRREVCAEKAVVRR